MKTIIIAGGTGFLGQSIEKYFSNLGYEIKILTRKPLKENHIYWDAQTLNDWTTNIENADVLINLTGKSVDCRYNAKNKKLIYDSRINSTTILGKAVQQCKQPPKLWMNASTATIYRYSLDKEMTELDGEFGNDFSMNIAKSWEKAFSEIDTPNTRKIILRTSIVLGKKAGAFIPLKTLTKLGMGGKQGSGKQKVSFIHELDFVRAVEFLIQNQTLNGAFNITVPKPTNNKHLMKTFRKELGIPFGIPQPEWILKIGSKIIGTEPELVLKSRNVIPQRLLNEGFQFNYPTIEKTIKNLIL
ncbi:MAG TPA: TIGR01777 family protein [Flavobacteriaceae bacterium]|jgi:uncharacterized protein (TIGR01777 family)|nr:TIGR01777 family protein [Flavobacteriaceae bacterium]